MPRTARKRIDNGIYHILQRGNNKRPLFKSPRDYEAFIGLLAKYKLLYPFELYNFCLMPNHVHLLMRIPDKDHIQKILQGVFQSFQFHHRKNYKYVGILYQNRFKSILISDDVYLAECARYIERNPLRAGIVSFLKDYRWSSYGFYSSNIKCAVLTENPFYISTGRNEGERKRLFIEYINQERPYDHIVDKIF